MFTNAQSIVSKISLLQTEVSTWRPDFVGVCESFCNDDHSDAYLSLEGYELVGRKDGNSTTRGIARGLLLWCKRGIQARVVEVEGGVDVTEMLVVRVTWGQEELNLCLVYRPPRVPGSQSDMGNTARMVDALRRLEGPTVLFGDMNIPGVDWERHWSPCRGETMVLDLLGDKFWTQHIRGATHKGGNTLDILTTSAEDMLVDYEIMGYLGRSDHTINIATLVGPMKEEESVEMVPDWGKVDFQEMNSRMAAINWEEELMGKAGLESMETFYEKINKVVEDCVPKKRRRQGSKPVWMSKKMMRMIRKKRRMWKAFQETKQFQKWQEFKKVQKEVQQAVKKAKRKVERKLAKGAKKCPKAFWSYIKKKMGNKVTVGPLREGGRTVTDSTEMSNILNDHYCRSFTREDLSQVPEAERLYRGEEPLVNVVFTREEVRKKLMELRPDSAPGPDRVWTKVLHRLADTIAAPLAVIFAKLMEEGNVPKIWKDALVCPIFKKGKKGDAANYRPVSLTCVLGKVMEKVMRDHMVAHLIKNSLIRSSQHGSQKGRSTTTNLLEYLEKLTEFLDKGENFDIIYLDFAKAFDSVPKERLLSKLEGVGVGGKVLSWIREWLTGRRQRVVLNGKESEWGEVRSGIVQGSVLGPVLFLIFINDLEVAARGEGGGQENQMTPFEVTKSVISLYVDDTKWGAVIRGDRDRVKFQESLDRLEKWSREWQLLFNVSKCKIMHGGRTNAGYTYTMGGRELEVTRAEKDVGVIVEDTLKPSMQCAAAAAKANRILGQLSRAVQWRDKITFPKLYMSHVRPVLEYAGTVWCPYLVGDRETLEKVQKRMVNMIPGMRGSYEDKLRALGMTTLQRRRERGDMIQTWRILTGKDRVDPANWFSLQGDQVRDGATSTRGHRGYQALLTRPPAKLEVRREFFSNRVVDEYNRLPDRVKMALNMNMFKARLDEHLGTPAPLQWRGRRGGGARPHQRRVEGVGPQPVA